MKIEISYLKALKLVVIRSAVAIMVGFTIGKCMAFAISKEWMTLNTIQNNPILVTLILAICGILSFLAYQLAVKRHHQEISLLLAARSVFFEFVYLFTFAAIALACLVVVGITARFLIGS